MWFMKKRRKEFLAAIATTSHEKVSPPTPNFNKHLWSLEGDFLEGVKSSIKLISIHHGIG